MCDCIPPRALGSSGVASPNRRKRWTVPLEVRLEWRTWNGHSVVFNAASGDTHLLDSTAAEVLKGLETRPMCIDELCAQVLELGETWTSAGGDPSSHIESLVTKFDELGLIAPSRP